MLALFLSSTAGCKKDEPPKPDPSASAAAPINSAKGKLNMRGPLGPMAKIDPQAMKDYRLDICYYGTFTLRQARESYLASLGKDEPSEKKIPNFGVFAPPTTTPPPAASAKAGAPAGSGSAAAGAAAPPRTRRRASPPSSRRPARGCRSRRLRGRERRAADRSPRDGLRDARPARAQRARVHRRRRAQGAGDG
ncbi:MAG: hypothetical protein U0359_37660 [Byssovorax sp.]